MTKPLGQDGIKIKTSIAPRQGQELKKVQIDHSRESPGQEQNQEKGQDQVKA